MPKKQVLASVHLTGLPASVQEARLAALEVLRHNARGPYAALPRTAGWGYPEPYTRDLMIAALGVLVSGDEALVQSLRVVLATLAQNQTRRGHIPSLVHDPHNLGASDTTPLFLIALACYRTATREADFLSEAALRALVWLEYQSPADTTLVAQQPTSDWRDEQWVIGHGLYVNVLTYLALRLHERHDQAAALRRLINQPVSGARRGIGLRLRGKPHYALWQYKVHFSARFDLLGNALAILAGIAPVTRARQIVALVEAQCRRLRRRKELASELPPCLFPFIYPDDPDWLPRYAQYNPPGHYHNGGIWPFVSGFYIAALVAARQYQLAERKLLALTALVRVGRNHAGRNHPLAFGFNEWFRAQDGTPQGQDWQTWSAAMYLYAATAVEQRRTPFFDPIRARAQP